MKHKMQKRERENSCALKKEKEGRRRGAGLERKV